MKLFLISIFILPFAVSGIELGASPADLDLKGMQGEEICQIIRIFSDREINMSIDTRWDKNETMKIVNITTGDLIINKSAYANICFIASKSGNFKGILFISDSNDRAKIGIPVKLDVKKGSLISGFAVFDKYEGKGVGIMAWLTLVELILLSYLVSKLVRKV